MGLQKGMRIAPAIIIMVALGTFFPATPLVHGQVALLPSWNDGVAKQAVISFVKEIC